MAEQMISPGVFTEERDETFLAQGVQEIGGAFVGPTQKGPAFTPVEVNSPQEYEEKFGNQGLYMDYSTRNYLRDASSATVVRLLGDEGYESEAVDVQLPEGELSKRPFEISKASFTFDPTDVQPGEEVEFSVCFRGRQRRSTDTELLEYNLEIEEHVDGEFHKLVYSEGPLNKDCVVDSFDVSEDDSAEVQYKVVAELANGQTATIQSPTGQLQGFYLDGVNYNWGDGATKGTGEIVSLQGTVANVGTGSYSYEIREVIDGELQTTPVDEGNGLTEETFEAAWVHNGSENERLQYVVRVNQGQIVDVPEEVSPAINVISRSESQQFELKDVNWNFEVGDEVDFGETLQVDAEASGPIDANLYAPGGSQLPAQDVSGNPNDSSIYIEFDVGSGGIDVSKGDLLDYELEINEQNGPGSATTVSPEVKVDGGVFQIGDVDLNVEQGEDVGEDQLVGLGFEVENRQSGDFDYEIYEVLNGGPSAGGSESVIESGVGVSFDSSTFGLSHSGTAGDDAKFRIEVSQDNTQGQAIDSSDSATTPTVDVINRSALGEFGIQEADFSFDQGETIEDQDKLFFSFQTDLDGAVDYDYDLLVVKNGTETTDAAVDGANVSSESVFGVWNVGDAGVDFYDGDTVTYRFRVEDSNGNTDEVDSPTLQFSGQPEQIFTFDDVEFLFVENSETEKNERLAVFADVRRPNDEAFQYEVTEYVNGNNQGTVVVDTAEEENQEYITDPDFERLEAGWFAGEKGGSNALQVGDTVEYKIEITEVDPVSGDPVSPANTAEEMSPTLTVTEREPRADITLATLAPTQRLRDDGDQVYNAQINPEKADITGFELILDLDGSSLQMADLADHEAENEVEELLEDEGIEPAGELEGPELIDGRKYEVSLQEGDDNYLLDLFGSKPESPREVHAKASFPEAWKELVSEELGELGINLKVHGNGADEDIDRAQLDFQGQEYDSASTPWIVSQDQQPNQEGAERVPLFKFHTLGDGDFANTETKVSIRNVRYPSEVAGSNYAQFDVVVRELGDTDTDPQVLESYTGLNLNPQSPNYIARVIGNKETTFNENGKIVERGGEVGVFDNRSDYIRAQVNKEVVRANEEGRDDLSNLVPWGFQPYQIPLDFKGQLPHGLKVRQVRSIVDADYDILPDANVPPQSSGLRTGDIDLSSAENPFDERIHFGVDFDWEGNMSWLQAIAENADGTDDQSEFGQEFGFVLSEAYVQDPNAQGLRQVQFGDAEDEGFSPADRKFTVGFQGGFDGMDPATPQELEEEIRADNSQGFDMSADDAPGTRAYEKAIGILGNEDQFDINLLVTPGIINSLHSPVVQSGINMVESRADAFYVFDAAGVDASIDGAIASVQSIDTNYAATYYPWLRIRDQTRNRQVRVPPSVLIPRVYAFNDQTAAEWFAPAGFERGGVPEAIAAVVRLRRDDRDLLYENRVNPIAQFPDQGVSVWGQKTLQTQASALDRVNVRRLLIRVKKFIASTSRFLVFEQNVPETRNRFKNIVNPFLNQVQQQNGLYAFRVKMDAENNPPEVIDRNQLVGELYLQPTRTAEYISLSFNVLPTGADFEG